MDDNNNNYYEHKNGQQYHEFINFAIQGMNENAQFAIAIAVGIFGILAIFVTLDTHKGMTPQDIFWKNALWTKPQWIWLTYSTIHCLLGFSSLWNSELCWPPYI